MTYFVSREDGARIEGLTKEQIYELINGTTGKIPEGVDEAFITKLKEVNKGGNVSIWIGTNNEYNALEVKDDNTLYVIVDDSYYSDVEERFNAVESRLDAIDERLNDINADYDSFEAEIDEKISKAETELDNKVREGINTITQSGNAVKSEVDETLADIQAEIDYLNSVL